MQEIEAYCKQFGDIPLPEKLHWLANTLVQVPEFLKTTLGREEAVTAGLVMGRRERGRFVPSFPLLDHIAKHTDRSITISDQIAYLFSCGRDIFGRQVDHIPEGQPKHVIVRNEHGEVLGVARNDVDKGMFQNTLDRGKFLRQEMD